MRVMRSASSPRPVYLRLIILLGCQVTHHIETLSRQKKNRAVFRLSAVEFFQLFVATLSNASIDLWAVSLRRKLPSQHSPFPL